MPVEVLVDVDVEVLVDVDVDVLVVVEVDVLVVDVLVVVEVVVAPPWPLEPPAEALLAGSVRLLREHAGIAARASAEAKKAKRGRMAHPTRARPQRKERAGRERN